MPIEPFGFRKSTIGGGSGGGAAFTPITDTYTAGSGTRSVPSGASHLDVEIYGKGGDGGTKSSSTGKGGGGGSGAYSKKGFTVAAGDYGKSIAWNTNNSSAVTVVGDATASNLTNSALNMSAGYGGAGGASSGGAAGTASGGTTNTSGTAGQSSSGGGYGANAPGPAGGLGGAPFNEGTDPGAGGGGGNNNVSPGSGGLPRIILTWT